MTPSRRRTKAADHGLRLLTVKQVADLWQLHEGRVRRMCHAGLIRHIRIGRWIRIPSHTLQEDLHALLDAGQIGAASRPDETWNA
ncbi:MAG: helix-turn-helix domain-containing protein [Chloroflexi bacterium]|nr:helix-turn-helix domain-containing protein [Chloroflexota bacterium]